jgi:hypothetical protein
MPWPISSCWRREMGRPILPQSIHTHCNANELTQICVSQSPQATSHGLHWVLRRCKIIPTCTLKCQNIPPTKIRRARSGLPQIQASWVQFHSCVTTPKSAVPKFQSARHCTPCKKCGRRSRKITIPRATNLCPLIISNQRALRFRCQKKTHRTNCRYDLARKPTCHSRCRARGFANESLDCARDHSMHIHTPIVPSPHRIIFSWRHWTKQNLKVERQTGEDNGD